ncbi:MarR family winged helix-turn-helix transcriptional regulator [Motilimonas eburnea]|uniref:MarR family winged helix-turn-helix transcriptional regulator n=1 Tax=Motilimonas eburnea TaxID=1737488 RepID=UPI001E6202B5|nr:helix-turn-helix domain-containing protein [Motilimonas eburnea]MCE2572957.1 MarR family transcriptional regulator [Motilimonas eburnea]
MRKADNIGESLERICMLFRNELRLAGLEYGLQPVHLEVLFYLSRADHKTNKPANVTEFLGITKGSASQSISLLAEKKLLIKRSDETDKRIVHLELTPEGMSLARIAIPPKTIRQALENAEHTKGELLQQQLQGLLTDIQGQLTDSKTSYE